MNHVFITRHGQCLHNIPGNNRLWQHANDDILGLTEDGIASTVEKADSLSTRLVKDLPVVFLQTGAVRSLQTASLLASRLRIEHGFDTSVSRVPYCELFREFPCPTGRTPWSTTFSFEKFKADPTYTDDGWSESFKQRFHKHRHRSSPETEDHFARELEFKLSVSHRGEVQAVIVSHHYASCAFLGALVSLCQCFSNEDNVVERVLQNAHKFYLTHGEVLYLTPLLYKEKKGPDFLFQEEWRATRSRLEAHVACPAGESLPSHTEETA